MEQSFDPRMQSSRPGFLAEVTLVLLLIRDRRASGRLSLRNAEQFGIVHLYFNEARLIHVTGGKCDAEAMLTDLLSWTKGSARFDSGMVVTFESLTWQQAQVFGRWLAYLEMRGIMQGIAQERLEGLARELVLLLPGEPIALPQEVEYREEYEAEARARQWQRINEGTRQLVERTLSDEQREQWYSEPCHAEPDSHHPPAIAQRQLAHRLCQGVVLIPLHEVKDDHDDREGRKSGESPRGQ